MFVFLLPVSLIAFSKILTMNLDLFTLFFLFFFLFLHSLYRNQRENLTLNVLNDGSRLEFASRNGTEIQRLHSYPLVQQEGVYTELFSESMMVIILTTKLVLPNMSLLKKGTKRCAILPIFNFLAVPLHVPLSLHLYCYSDAPWLWSFDIKLSIIYKFDCFINLP